MCSFQSYLLSSYLKGSELPNNWLVIATRWRLPYFILGFTTAQIRNYPYATPVLLTYLSCIHYQPNIAIDYSVHRFKQVTTIKVFMNEWHKGHLKHTKNKSLMSTQNESSSFDWYHLHQSYRSQDHKWNNTRYPSLI